MSNSTDPLIKPAFPTIRVGMVGLGMIFDDTYRPCFAELARIGLYSRGTGPVDVRLTGLASRTGSRAKPFLDTLAPEARPANFDGTDAVAKLLAGGVDVVCIATPDDRHFEPARQALAAGKHVLIEKPSVLTLAQLDHLNGLAQKNGVLAKVVYHKLLDPDHKKLRTHVADGVLEHVHSGYCSLLEPKQVSGQQFAEWITGRNPGTYVGVHYLKLIDFSFRPPDRPNAWRLARVNASGQRGLVGSVSGGTWDAVQLQVTYRHANDREATFDIHTNWVTPDNFPGYVEQEVQFRFDNGVWKASQRQRGVELTVEGRTPHSMKNTPNHHYNGTFLEPWGERSQRGYGIEAVRCFFEEVAFVEYGQSGTRDERLAAARTLDYDDLSADRQVVAAVQALESILDWRYRGRPGAQVLVNFNNVGLTLQVPGVAESEVLYVPLV